MNLKKLFRGKDGELSLLGRLAAGACAGMTSTFVSNAFMVICGIVTFLVDEPLPVNCKPVCQCSTLWEM